MFLKRKKIIIGLALFFLLLLPNDSQAIEIKSVGVMPAFPDPNVFGSDIRFAYNLNLGEKKQDGLRLINNGDETVIVKVYPVDAVTTPDGSYALLPEEAPVRDIGSWIRLAANEVELAPKTEKTVPFVIQIPANADAGDHMGGLIMQEINTLDTLSGTGVKVITRVGIRVQETVPGEVRKSFSLTMFDYHYAATGVENFFKDFLDINKKTVFSVGIKNEGNIRIMPKATLEVKNIFGMSAAHLPDRNLGEILPRGENSESTVVWDDIPMLGRYTVKITVDPGQPGMESKTSELVIWAFPFKIAFLLVLLFILMTLARLIGLYFREASKEKMPIYKVKLGDNLADLGQKFSVSWEKIAKMNFIGEPFEIKEGEKLFIPIGRKNRDIMEQFKGQGEFLPSIIERSGVSRFKKKRTIIIIIIFILAGGGAAWGIKLRQNKVIHQEIPVPQTEKEEPKETAEKTKSGAFKKSSVKTAIVSGNEAMRESSARLLKKLEFIGYSASLVESLGVKDYKKTTIEYSPEKKEQAEMVKNDIKFATDPDMREVPDLESGIVIYNFSPQEDFFFLE